MNVIIIEDEVIAARRLEKMLLTQGLKVIQKCTTLSDTEAYLNSHPEPDLYFMDIQLGDGLIFELFENVSITAPIIFTTAYDQYAIRAFKQNSIDYLLKPIDKQELSQALEKYRSLNTRSRFDFNALEQLLSQQSPTPSYKQRLMVRVGEQLKSITLSDITHIYSENKSTWVHEQSGRTYAIDTSLGDLIQQLNPTSFFQISRGCIVNIDFIEKIHAFSSSRLKLELKNCKQDDIVVAKGQVAAFKEWLDS